MKYDIKIMGKDECIFYSGKELSEDCIIISINDSNHRAIFHKNNRIKDILVLEFDDITLEQYQYCKDESLRLFSIEDTLLIKEFVEKYKNDIKTIIIHCTAGISRSGAVGCCLARYLNGEDEYLLKTGKYIPNEWVYTLLCNRFGLICNKKLFKEKIRIRNKASRETLRGYDNYGIYLDDMFDIEIERN